jgi:hypothetical protein
MGLKGREYAQIGWDSAVNVNTATCEYGKGVTLKSQGEMDA